ncbi:hypothetical protein ACNKHW_01120 [Shigella flexneri]
MRKSGAQAAKKAGRVAAEGVILSAIDGNSASFEVNCETTSLQKIPVSCIRTGYPNFVVAGKMTDVEASKHNSKKSVLLWLLKSVKTSASPRAALEGDMVGSYMHGARIGVLVAAPAQTKN